MATRTKTRTRTNTKTIAIAAAVVGLAAAAGLGYNMVRRPVTNPTPVTNTVVTPTPTPTPTTGTLLIQNLKTPASTIVIAGKDIYTPFATYEVTAVDEDLTIDRVAVSNLTGGDNADFNYIAVASNGTVRGQSALPAGQTGNVDIDLAGNAITISKGGIIQFQIWAKLAPVMASAVVNGSWTGVARSGHTPALGLSSNLQTGNWTSDYANKLNVRATGVQSGKLYLANAGSFNGNQQVIRKSKPIVAKLLLNVTYLMGTSGQEMEIQKFKVGADQAGPVAIKQIAFKINKSQQVSIGYLRLYRNSSQIPSSDYFITEANTAVDLKATNVATGTNSIIAVIAFKDEEVVSGSGNVYTLRAVVNYPAIPGNSLSTYFLRDPYAPVVTGNLSNNVKTNLTVSSPNIFAIGARAFPGTFVWSDNSEVPHSASVPGSADWTNDVYVQALDGTSLSN
ncbi:MAG: hypothetical protein PHC53_01975 [Patescibacteria group bacterium]|nr:hypothetical protein [Patescibacteria group bacterium]